MRACFPRVSAVLATCTRTPKHHTRLFLRSLSSAASPSSSPNPRLAVALNNLKQPTQAQHEPTKQEEQITECPYPPPGKYKFVDPGRPEVFVETLAQLESVMKYLQSHDVLGVDTEFVSSPYYRPSLEVLQISSPEVMLAIDCRSVMIPNLQPLIELIMQKEVILHSCQSDLQILLDLANKFQLTQKVPRAIFDTQIAAAFLQTKPMMAFKVMLQEYFGVAMDKANTLSDWSKRPFTPQQIKYALEDVRHLHALRDHLTAELKAIGRWEWCKEEFDCMTNPLIWESQEPDDAWRGIFQARKFETGSKELNVARSLAAWREKTAKRVNLLPGYLLKNETVIGMSAMIPTTKQELTNVQGLKPNTLRIHSGAILAAIQLGLKTAESQSPTHRTRHKEGGRLREGLFNLLQSRVQTVANANNLSALHLVPRQELWDLASVSLPALQKAATLGPEHFKPVKMISHLMNLKWELLPEALSTQPKNTFSPTRQSAPEVTSTGHKILDPFTFEEEMDMLCKLKVLSGWRREMVGNDLLAIAMGNSLAWDETSGSSAFSQERAASLESLGDTDAQEQFMTRVSAWVEGLNEQDRDVLRALTSMIDSKLTNLAKSEEDTAGLSTTEVDVRVGKMLEKVSEFIKR